MTAHRSRETATASSESPGLLGEETGSAWERQKGRDAQIRMGAGFLFGGSAAPSQLGEGAYVRFREPGSLPRLRRFLRARGPWKTLRPLFIARGGGTAGGGSRLSSTG